MTEARILRAAPEKLAPAQGIPTPFFSVTRLGEDLGNVDVPEVLINSVKWQFRVCFAFVG